MPVLSVKHDEIWVYWYDSHMEKDAKIYVAGHRGLVGSATVRALKRHGYTNIVGRTHAELDLMDTLAVKDFFEKEKPEYVVLAAARVGGIKENMTYPAEFLYQNLVIQNNILWQSHVSDVKKLLFLGSSCIYPRMCPQPMKEEYLLTGQLEPTNEGYALAKIAGLKQCEYLHTEYGKKFIACMPCNMYGEGDHFDAEKGHVIGSLLVRIHKAKIENTPQIAIWGTGNARREFLFDEDLAESIVYLLEHYDAKEFVNIGSGIDISIKELANMIKEVVGYEGELTFDTSKPDGMPQKLMDVSKIEATGWKHQVSLEEGLRRTYAAYLKTLHP